MSMAHSGIDKILQEKTGYNRQQEMAAQQNQSQSQTQSSQTTSTAGSGSLTVELPDPREDPMMLLVYLNAVQLVILLLLLLRG